LPKTNELAAPSFLELWDAFFHAAAKYKQEHKKIPVIIFDNANNLAKNQLELLELIQDDAKRATDNGTATVVFVSSEGYVPRFMMGKLVLFIVLFIH